MNRKSKIIISITGIVIISLILIGLTYGYYMTKINGNTNDKSISINMANLELTYNDGNGLIEATNIIPGESIKTKTFTVKNTGNAKIDNYVVYLDDVVNTFVDKNDLRLTLKCTSDVASCNGTIINYPSKNTILITNNIEKNETQSFELIVEFIETNDDQSDNMEKTLSGNIVIKDIKGTNNTLENITGTNNILIENGELLNNYKIFGNSTQNGTPTPDSPVEVESVGDLITDTTDINYGKYKIPIIVSGLNKMSSELEIGGIGGNTGVNYSTTTRIRTKEYIEIKPNTRYTLILPSEYTYVNAHAYDENYNFITAIYIMSTATPSNAKYIRFSVKKDDQTLTETDLDALKTIMLVEGTDIVPYEPYKQAQTYNIYLDEPLRKINEFSDYVDFKSGKVVRNIYAGILDGTESWSLGGTTSNDYQTYYSRKYSGMTLKGNRNCLSNKFNFKDGSIWTAPAPYLIQTGSNDKVCYITLPKSIASDISQAKQFFNENNSKYYFILNTSKEESVSMPNINLNSTKNYISIDTTTSPSNIELEVIK